MKIQITRKWILRYNINYDKINLLHIFLFSLNDIL